MGGVMLENKERGSMNSGKLSAEGSGQFCLCASLYLWPWGALPPLLACTSQTFLLLHPPLHAEAGSTVVFGATAEVLGPLTSTSYGKMLLLMNGVRRVSAI